jgi:hypothetical protein
MTHLLKHSRFNRLSVVSMTWIIRATVCLIVLTLVAFALLYNNARTVRQQTLASVMNKTAGQVTQQVIQFFEPVSQDLQLLCGMGAHGALSLDASPPVEAIVRPLLRKHTERWIGLTLADTQGRIVQWKRDAQQWQRVASPSAVEATLWFREALEASVPEIPYRTPVYLLASSGAAGFTQALAFQVEGQEGRYVIAIDIALQDVAAAMDTLDLPVEHRLFAQSGNEVFDWASMDADPVAAPSGTGLLADPVVSKAIKARADGQHMDTAFRLVAAGEVWWGQVSTFNPSGPPYLYLLLPERALAGSLNNTVLILFLGGAVILGVLLMVLVLGVRQQQRQLMSTHARPGLLEATEAALLQVMQEGESDAVELKSTLRWNLKANRADKVMELACLKSIAAFLNSNGGTLIVGVEDDGHVLGIQADHFANEDKFLLHLNNLIKQHLGAEHASDFRFGIRLYQNERILVVDCDRSTGPVFVKHDKQEDFFIRMGPGTRLLSTSEALEYIGSHFHSSR